MTDDNWLKPVVETDPSQLRVSTFAEPEYGSLVFRFGRDHAGGGVDWPVYCTRLTISIPTGRNATALTGDPQLIGYSASPVSGGDQGRKWDMQRNTTDPNKVVFACVPEMTAKFDGTWQVNFTMSGIEVNGAIGTVSITIDELTSPTSDGDFELRTGHAEVVKRDDSFYFHSFRPTNQVVDRNSPVTLDWNGSSNATYTMFYRDKNGRDQANTLDNPGGTWTLTEGLLDNTNFTLKATIGDKDYYQTTHVTVDSPNTTVNQLTVVDTLSANGNVTVASDRTLTTNGTLNANGDVSVTGSGKILRVGDLRGPYGASLRVNSTIEVLPGNNLTVHDDATVNGTLNANGDVTVTGGGKILRVGDLRGPYGASLRVNSTIEVLPGNNLVVHDKLRTNTIGTSSGGKVTIEGDVDLGALKAQDLTVKWGNQDEKLTTVGFFGVKVNGDLVLPRLVRSHYSLDLPNPGYDGYTTRTYRANTPGIVVGDLTTPGPENEMIIISTDGRYARANWAIRGGQNSVTMPVAEGSTFEIGHKVWGDRRGDHRFWFVPFGALRSPDATALSLLDHSETTGEIDATHGG